jgi:pyruvate dehydrogenase E1 component
VREDIVRGMYRLRAASKKRAKAHATLLGSGAITNQVAHAQEILEADYGVATDLWSVTSYQQLHREALAVERRNRLSAAAQPEVPFVARCLDENSGVVVAASDYMKALPYSIAPWVRAPFVALGTDGFGRSDDRPSLRAFFEVDHRHVVYATLERLWREGAVERKVVLDAARSLNIDRQAPDPAGR